MVGPLVSVSAILARIVGLPMYVWVCTGSIQAYTYNHSQSMFVIATGLRVRMKLTDRSGITETSGASHRDYSSVLFEYRALIGLFVFLPFACMDVCGCVRMGETHLPPPNKAPDRFSRSQPPPPHLKHNEKTSRDKKNPCWTGGAISN
jgi:hypothetical protein